MTSNETEKNDLQIDNLPNRLTLFRIVLIPLVLGALYFSRSDSGILQHYKIQLGWLAGWLFALASLTDFFDGYIARKRGIVTVFGSFLDPIADKFLVVSSLIMLQALERINVFIVIILVLREMYMTSLRLLASSEGISVPVDQWGKWKTATQMIAIPFIMVNQKWWIISFQLWGDILLYISAVLSLSSALRYSLQLIKKLKLKRIERKKIKKALRNKLNQVGEYES
jgi:CDP-diacylglycerol--glycerol-3-phosphate 3-phosphatidyltransferase